VKRPTKNDPWGIPINLGRMVNSSANESHPEISSDGLELFFGSDRAGGSGEFDLWVTRRPTTEDDWGNLENLGSGVNSSGWDFNPRISPNRLVLYFRSERLPGSYLGGDIWVTRRQTIDDPWGPPVYVGTTDERPVGERGEGDAGLSFSTDGSTLYFCADNRPGGFGRYDLWQTAVVPLVDFNGDGRVDGFEFTKVVSHWGENEPSCDIGPTPLGDGVVDVQDLTTLSEYIGKDIDDPTLVAHWSLDEAEGILAVDSVGENHADVMGEATWLPTEGVVGGALLLDGANDYMATQAVRDPSEGPLSVFAWIQGGTPGQVIVAQIAGVNWLTTDDASGALKTNLKQPGRQGKSLVSDIVITDGNWHRVGLVWDGEYRSLYVDDVMVATDAQAGLANSGGGLLIGCDKSMTVGTFWAGMFDDVRIYNRAVKP
jgi:hypothetical protein